jgi:dynein heavy chain 2
MNFIIVIHVFFAIGIMTNLHVVLVMDCTNATFSVNCESNPAFFKECSVQWLDGWSRDSMIKVI